MAVLSDTLLFYPTGEHQGCVYAVQPQHLPRDDIKVSFMWGQQFGQPVAYLKDDVWYRPGGWEEIKDIRTIVLLERVPVAGYNEIRVSA